MEIDPSPTCSKEILTTESPETIAVPPSETYFLTTYTLTSSLKIEALTVLTSDTADLIVAIPVKLKSAVSSAGLKVADSAAPESVEIDPEPILVMEKLVFYIKAVW